MECTQSRLEEPEAENGPDYSFHENSATPLRLLEEQEGQEGILLKTFRPYRTYSLRLAKRSSLHQQEQDNRLNNGPSRSHFGLFGGQALPGDDAVRKNSPSVWSAPRACSTMVHCKSCQAITSRDATPDGERDEVMQEEEEGREEEDEASSESGCSDAHSEMEVIMTTSC